VLSRSNTPAEMQGKREEYFEAGVAVVWMVDPEERRVTVFTSLADSVAYGLADIWDGGAVLPGFSLPLHDLFAELDRRPNR
jgi:Uma2 family endonuclease